MNAVEQRKWAVRQYVVYQIKLIELLHIIILSTHLDNTSVPPENVIGHGVDRFRETLLGAAVTAFMALNDKSASTNIREIWAVLFPTRKDEIARVWEKEISEGEAAMLKYRNRAGAHGDTIDKYFDAKLTLHLERDKIIAALYAFLGLSIEMGRVQDEEFPDFGTEVEAVLLDVEARRMKPGSFNRKWLKEMHLIKGGRYTRVFGPT